MLEKTSPQVIVGRVGRRASNALTVEFTDGPGAPVATAKQGGAGGFGGRFAIALGLRNHGPGRHLSVTREGDRIVTDSGYNSPSVITRNSEPALSVTCGGFTRVCGADGVERFRVERDPDRASTSDVDRMLVVDARGMRVALIEVILARTGWTIRPGDLLDLGLSVANDGLLGLLGDGSPRNGSLPIRILGTRLIIPAPVSLEERDLLLGLCVDLTIGGRDYVVGD
ncbi:hypothetical protein [Subtercola boreus]|uniref:Uncharacterized protein n=1 Tax=Subtercola boreus TaxID=120213 RepID=A0A3E0WDP9_9MICO|nr:hypothetical protein [Subtercola boreus]RFA21047.1 hypothetical protein B7R24_06480 [Subtercola boreus]RFA21431.1 hypothetical protein B7R23_06425 [Subtercola boreus]RFA27402.1 hypothetical protein B7R25_06550 [Subtercola boreus]